jgi:hypothetical protein
VNSRPGFHWKLLTPNRKRSAVKVLRERFGVSERRTCTVVGIHRSTMRLGPPPITAEEAKLGRGCAGSSLTGLAGAGDGQPRWAAERAGRSITSASAGFWREEGLRVPQRRKRKRLAGIGVTVGAMSPIRPIMIWAMDFQFDTTADGILKMLNVIDEFTREALAIEVDRGIDADGERRITCTLTTVLSSWRTPSVIGADSTVPVRFSLIPARRGKMPGSNRSTAGYAMNCSTHGASTRCAKPA